MTDDATSAPRAVLLTPRQAGRLWGKSVFTIRRWCRAGKVEAVKDPGGRGWLVKFTGVWPR